jgi:hypothetical protein
VSLFQNRDETVAMENSELAQYSCSRLLTEMEATVSGSEEENHDMLQDENELVRLPEQWIQEALGVDQWLGLPENLYDIPEARAGTDQQLGGKDGGRAGIEVGNVPKKKWGPVLVEKRPSRNPGDNRTMMEKARARKKSKNLDGAKGIVKSHNPFSVMSSDEITSIAKDVGIKLGNSIEEIDRSIVEVQESDSVRGEEFRGNCVGCQGNRMDNDPSGENCQSLGDVAADPSGEISVSLVGVDVDPQTPVEQMCPPQMEDSGVVPGQWTLVANRRKTKCRKLL